MGKATLILRKPGMLTTIQDAGRMGYHHMGVPVSGPMDARAARIANYLVGNRPGSPLLEITLLGPVIEVVGNVQLAITGADLKPAINNTPAAMYQTLKVKSGSIITFGNPPVRGCRAYIAVGGSWDVPSWLGSSSYLPGLALDFQPEINKGKHINISTNPELGPRQCPEHLRFQPGATLRVLPGPEFGFPGKNVQNKILKSSFSLSQDSNRMGYRLEPGLDVEGINFNIISSGVLPGTVQLTPSGQFVLLMRDAQTTGGYPRVLQVIQADMDRGGQLKPGDAFKFELTTEEIALKAWEGYLEEEKRELIK